MQAVEPVEMKPATAQFTVVGAPDEPLTETTSDWPGARPCAVVVPRDTVITPLLTDAVHAVSPAGCDVTVAARPVTPPAVVIWKHDLFVPLSVVNVSDLENALFWRTVTVWGWTVQADVVSMVRFRVVE